MFKVIKINRCAATTFIDMLNLETGTVDKCFDDSAVVSYQNFDFMEEGEIYDCKIELFGNFTDKANNLSTELTIVGTGVVVGKTKYLKVMIGDDVYFIPESEVKNVELKRKMHYVFTRKDLIQADDVIHADCL